MKNLKKNLKKVAENIRNDRLFMAVNVDSNNPGNPPSMSWQARGWMDARARRELGENLIGFSCSIHAFESVNDYESFLQDEDAGRDTGDVFYVSQDF